MKFIYTTILAFITMAGVAQEEKTIVIFDSIALEFIRVAPGTFTMGSPEGDLYAQADEFPAHQVTLTEPFYLGKFEVTQRAWEAVMGYNPSTFRHPDHPVDMVSWNDCMRFIRKLNTIQPGTFRLPTEAEWEFVASVGENDYWSEDGILQYWQLTKYAWFNSRAEGKSHPIGEKLPNKLGFYDIQGNVWEWCMDWLGPYPDTAQVNPGGPEWGSRKAYRGGSWFNEPQALRPSNRHGHPPDTYWTNAGFRLVYIPD